MFKFFGSAIQQIKIEILCKTKFFYKINLLETAVILYMIISFLVKTNCYLHFLTI